MLDTEHLLCELLLKRRRPFVYQVPRGWTGFESANFLIKLPAERAVCDKKQLLLRTQEGKFLKVRERSVVVPATKRSENRGLSQSPLAGCWAPFSRTKWEKREHMTLAGDGLQDSRPLECMRQHHRAAGFG